MGVVSERHLPLIPLIGMEASKMGKCHDFV